MNQRQRDEWELRRSMEMQGFRHMSELPQTEGKEEGKPSQS